LVVFGIFGCFTFCGGTGVGAVTPVFLASGILWIWGGLTGFADIVAPGPKPVF